MTETVMVALISFAGIVVSGIISAIVSMKLVNHRLESLEKKVDEHNGYAQKFAEAHEDISLIKRDIMYIKERLH